MRKTWTILAALSALALAAASLAGAATSRATDDNLSGAGSTFVAPLVSSWITDWGASSGVQVAYSPIGSGGGIAAITARTVDFGASDAPLSPDQFKACNGCVQIPWALAATSVPYNLPGVKNNLKMTGPVLSDIFLGKVTKWNDKEIASLNPGVDLPDLQITPVYRSDASGTTYNFTDYLSKVSPEWKSKVGKSTQVSFPVGTGARGSSGVAGVVSRTPGAVTYVDIAYAMKNRLFFFNVKNRAGKFASPGTRGILAAAASVTTIPADNAISIVDPPATNKLAYPISTYTYIIVPLKTAKARRLKQFMLYAISVGQKLAPRQYFAPLPDLVREAAAKTIARVQPST